MSYRGEQGAKTECPHRGACDRQHCTGAQPCHPEGPPHRDTPGGCVCSRASSVGARQWGTASTDSRRKRAHTGTVRRDPHGASRANLSGFPAPLTSD